MLGVNTTMAIYSKSGSLKLTWTFDSMFSPVMPPGAKIFDPKVAYDHYANRWIVVLAATRASPQGAWLMVGVSKTSDPQGGYFLWALDATLDGTTPSNNWADYPQLGFDTQAIYITSNMFKFGGSFSYVKLRILNKSQLYSGGTVSWRDFWNLTNPNGSISFTVQPCVHFTGIGGNPPAYFVNALWPGGNSLIKWTLTDPLGSPTISRSAVSCLTYNLPPDAQQLGTTTPIETNDSRLLNAVYQSSPGGEKRLWTCHTSNYTWSGTSSAVSVVQWYEIDVSTDIVVQQGLYGASGQYYFLPVILTNISRDAFVLFGRSAATIYGQLRQTGRLVSAPPNTLEPDYGICRNQLTIVEEDGEIILGYAGIR